MKIISILVLFLCSSIHLPAQQLYRFEKNGKYGFKNASGKIIVKPVYDGASDSVITLGGVRNKDLWAVINNSGKLVTDFKYNGGVGNAKGFDLVPVYKSSGFMGVNSYYGIVNKAGVEIASPEFVFVEIVSNELAVVARSDQYGIMNTVGQFVIPMQFSKETLKIFNNIQPSGAYIQNGQWKAFSFDGTSIKKWKYDDIVIEGEYLWPVKYKNKWGFVDTLGREIVIPTYDSVGSFLDGVALVSAGGKKGVIDRRGNPILPVQYEFISWHGMGNYLVSANGKFGLVNEHGKILVPLKYNAIQKFTEGLAPVQIENKWGFIDQEGKEVIKPFYDAVLPFSDGMTAILLNKKAGFINKAGNMIIEPQFDEVVEPFYKGKAIVIREGKEIYIDSTGKEIK